ncbi:MAG: cyaB 4 [Gemmataceae bacterium]|nr:cyaB 4 [Gemmataceae bacterium]
MQPVEVFPVPGGEPAGRPVVLVVDDSQIDQRVAGRLLEQDGEWQVGYAGDGVEALEAVAQAVPQVVLTDLQMPRMDGLALVVQIRTLYPRLPVILMTGQGSEEVAVAALRAGAAGYVTKRNRAVDLVPAVVQVFAASRTSASRDRALGCLRRKTLRFVLDNDPTLVSPLVGLLRDDLAAFGVCDDNATMRAGIALEEALLNAIYHGNLEVSSDLKQESDEAFNALAAERRREAPYRDRRVRVGVHLTPAGATFVISDQGPGFDTAKVPDPTDPEALLRPCGRGMMLMQMFMDEVSYNPVGNRVRMTKRKAPAR